MLIIFFYCAGEIYCQAERVQAGQKHRRTYPLRRNWPRRRPQAAVPPPEAGLVPELRREAEIVQVLVEGGDLRRESTSRSNAINKALISLWDRYTEDGMVTSAFLAAVGNVYGVRT